MSIDAGRVVENIGFMAQQFSGLMECALARCGATDKEFYDTIRSAFAQIGRDAHDVKPVIQRLERHVEMYREAARMTSTEWVASTRREQALTDLLSVAAAEADAKLELVGNDGETRATTTTTTTTTN